MNINTFNKHILGTYGRYPVNIVSGQGSKVWDDDGNEYLDMFPGFGAGNVGHRHPLVLEALYEQLDKIIHVPNVYYNPLQAQLSEKISEYSFPSKAFFCNSGTEANETAIKFCRKTNPSKNEIITLKNSFHGRTLGSLSATGQPKLQEGFQSLVPGFKYSELNDVEMLKSLVNKKTAAIMLEPILGEGGIQPLSKEFMAAARKLCNKNNCLLILDEVQSGMGRTGKMFAYQHYGIEPDLMTVAKSLGGGLPIGALIVNNKIENVLTPGSHGSTFGGNSLACAAGLGVFKAFEKEKLLNKTVDTGKFLVNELEKLAKDNPAIIEIRSIGLMIGIELSETCGDMVDKFRKKGILTNCTQQKVLRVMPALNISKEDLLHFLKVFKLLIK